MSDRINTCVPIIEIGTPNVAELVEVAARTFRMNGCSIIVSHEGPAIGWHISIARRDRDPTWDEIATARYRLLPEVDEMVMHLPAAAEYVNLNAHCFHLFEVVKSKLDHASTTWN